jgi:cobalt/nickel transport system permease protein
MLAILLGPYAGFLVIASVLTIQALFFADGGLLALGCNILNIGFFSCFIVYPLIYKKIVGENSTRGRIVTGSLVAAIAGLQLGSFGVVVETLLSGITELPFFAFLALMQPIHLAIGVVEGLVTAMLVVFIWKARPEILEGVRQEQLARASMRGIVIALLLVAAITAGGLSWFASSHPDGLQWAMLGASGKEELDDPGGNVHSTLQNLQEKTAILPNYGFKRGFKNSDEAGDFDEESSHWPAGDPGTTVSGLLGGTLTLFLAGGVGFAVRRRNKPTSELTTKG